MTNWEDPREAAIAFVGKLKPHPNASYVMELQTLLEHYQNKGYAKSFNEGYDDAVNTMKEFLE